MRYNEKELTSSHSRDGLCISLVRLVARSSKNLLSKKGKGLGTYKICYVLILSVPFSLPMVDHMSRPILSLPFSLFLCFFLFFFSRKFDINITYPLSCHNLFSPYGSRQTEVKV